MATVRDFWNWLPAYQVGLGEFQDRENRTLRRDTEAERARREAEREARIEAYQRRALDLQETREDRIERQAEEAMGLRADAEERLRKQQADKLKRDIGMEIGYTGQLEGLTPEQLADAALQSGIAAGRLRREQEQERDRLLTERMEDRFRLMLERDDARRNAPAPIGQPVLGPDGQPLQGVNWIGGRVVQERQPPLFGLDPGMIFGPGSGTVTNTPAPSNVIRFDRTGKRIQ